MAIKVRCTTNRHVYLLLGAGFGAYKSSRPSRFLGDIAPTEDAGQMEMIAVCDGDGNVRWLESHDVQVIDFDGHTPAELLV